MLSRDLILMKSGNFSVAEAPKGMPISIMNTRKWTPASEFSDAIEASGDGAWAFGGR